MTHDEVSFHGLVNIAENRPVTLGWSEIMGDYNTTDTTAEIGQRKVGYEITRDALQPWPARLKNT